jgi:hypothetical protein
MRIRIKERRVFEEKEKELLDFARSYLSEAFPNPDRQGCPPDAALRSLAFKPNESEPSVSDHLAVCSPCFRRYSELLAELKSYRAAEERFSWRRTYTWSMAHPLLVGAGLLCALFIAIGARVLLNRIRVPNPLPLDAHRARTSVQPVNPGVAYSPFNLDLTKASPIRGSKPPATGSERRVRVPSSPLDLTLALPLGSEEQSYYVRLRAGDHTFWSKSAQAHLHNGQILIQVEADFRQVPAGSYNLEIESSTGIRLTQPVMIKAVFPKSTEQKR